MIKKILIAVAFPLCLKAQEKADTILLTDSTLFISVKHMLAVLKTLPKTATIGEKELLEAFINAVINKAAADYNPKPKIESK